MAITDPYAVSTRSRAAQEEAFIDLHSYKWVDYGSIADGAVTAPAFRFSKRDGVFEVEFTSETKNGSFVFKASGLGTESDHTLALLNAFPSADVLGVGPFASGANVVEADATLVVNNTIGGTAFASQAGDIQPCIDTDSQEIGIMQDLGVAVNVRIRRIG